MLSPGAGCSRPPRLPPNSMLSCGPKDISAQLDMIIAYLPKVSPLDTSLVDLTPKTTSCHSSPHRALDESTMSKYMCSGRLTGHAFSLMN